MCMVNSSGLIVVRYSLSAKWTDSEVCCLYVTDFDASHHRSHWGVGIEIEKSPCRCVVLGGAFQGIVHLNKSLGLFGPKAPVESR